MSWLFLPRNPVGSRGWNRCNLSHPSENGKTTTILLTARRKPAQMCFFYGLLTSLKCQLLCLLALPFHSGYLWCKARPECHLLTPALSTTPTPRIIIMNAILLKRPDCSYNFIPLVISSSRSYYSIGHDIGEINRQPPSDRVCHRVITVQNIPY